MIKTKLTNICVYWQEWEGEVMKQERQEYCHSVDEISSLLVRLGFAESIEHTIRHIKGE